MKINISRQSIYLLSLSLVLLVFVLLFSFLVLIPEGKSYRAQKIELKKENVKLQKYQNYHDETLEILKELQSKNRHIITAFDTAFNPKRFEKQHMSYFKSLNLAKQTDGVVDEEFIIYEVNTTSAINSPKSFYEFLDAVNKSDWIVGINFPINFKREDEMIHSSFTMKVYGLSKDTNRTTAE